MQFVVYAYLLHRTTRPVLLLHKITVLQNINFGLPRRFAVTAPVRLELREARPARPSANSVSGNPSGLGTSEVKLDFYIIRRQMKRRGYVGEPMQHICTEFPRQVRGDIVRRMRSVASLASRDRYTRFCL